MLSSRGRAAPVLALDDIGPQSGRGLGALLGTAMAVCRCLRRRRPSVVVSHAPLTAVLVSACALAVGVPRRILVVHTGRSILPPTVRRLMYLAALVGVITDVVHVGESVKAQYADGPRTFTRRARVIPNSVPSVGNARAVVRTEPPYRLVVAGRLIPAKRVDLAIATASRLGDRCRLEVIGDGPERAALEQMAAEVGADVAFLGHLDRAATWTHCREADLMLFPSDLPEGLPLVLLESLGLGLPVVSKPTAAATEALGEAGTYCDGGTEDWFAVVQALLAAPEKRRELQRRALERATTLSPDRLIGLWERLLWP